MFAMEKIQRASHEEGGHGDFATPTKPLPPPPRAFSWRLSAAAAGLLLSPTVFCQNLELPAGIMGGSGRGLPFFSSQEVGACKPLSPRAESHRCHPQIPAGNSGWQQWCVRDWGGWLFLTQSPPSPHRLNSCRLPAH